MHFTVTALKGSPSHLNPYAAAAVEITTESPESYISHNKFIVKLEDGRPSSVWTGGTNFSEGGIYGHANTAHVVEEPAIAAKFLEYWTTLASDPESHPLKSEVERISLNSHVRYVHNKFMLINPLTDDPVVVNGSANFSDASTRRNDENMVITRGNTRIADIFLGEFIRLFTHHAFRESLKWRNPNDPPKPLRTDDWWRNYFGHTPRSTRRRYFARTER